VLRRRCLQEHGFHTFVRSYVANPFEVVEMQPRPNKNMHPALGFYSSRPFSEAGRLECSAQQNTMRCVPNHTSM
ncbi:MAG: hypothetical protein KGJ51_04015, partial [Acidobacteriota bacterium]|nr:hypothetical protein [Acidobacteriota bacterium]